MFDQQIHYWRWTGNATHEALLYPSLAMHAEWAGDCFDADINGLYQSYSASVVWSATRARTSLTRFSLFYSQHVANRFSLVQRRGDR